MERVPFPFYLMQLSVVLSLSAYSMGCHTAAAAAAESTWRRGEKAWQQCPLVAAGGTCGNLREVLKEEPEVEFKQRRKRDIILTFVLRNTHSTIFLFLLIISLSLEIQPWRKPREGAPEQPTGWRSWSSFKSLEVTLSEPKPCLDPFVRRPPKWASLPATGDEKTGDRIMRWLVFDDDEQALVSEHFNVRTDSVLISSSNDHFTVYCRSNCMFCSRLRLRRRRVEDISLLLPSKRRPLSLSNLPRLFSFLPPRPSITVWGTQAYLWSPLRLNEAWQIRSSENHVG